jgi:uncharacterized protein
MKFFAVLASLFLLTGIVCAQDTRPPKIVRVIGTAEVKVVPDRAVIELGVQKQDPNAGAAKRAADATARRILSAVRANGIDEKDVQTTYLSLQPESYVRKGVRISYFVAQQTLAITVRDLDKLDGLLEKILQAGGNRIDSISYETSDLRKYRDQARDLAVKAAHEKATALAHALGQEAGKAYAIEEVADSGGYMGGYTRNYQVAVAGNLGVDSGTPERGRAALAPGQRTISASVIVSFDLN